MMLLWQKQTSWLPCVCSHGPHVHYFWLWYVCRPQMWRKHGFPPADSLHRRFWLNFGKMMRQNCSESKWNHGICGLHFASNCFEDQYTHFFLTTSWRLTVSKVKSWWCSKYPYRKMHCRIVKAFSSGSCKHTSNKYGLCERKKDQRESCWR